MSNSPQAPPATQRLQSLMKAANIPSYRSLAQRAEVSRWQIQQLRSGRVNHMRVATLSQIAGALEISLEGLLQQFSDRAGRSSESSPSFSPKQAVPEPTVPKPTVSNAICPAHTRSDAPGEETSVAGESQHRQREALQTEALQTLETWLTQWATIAKRAQERGDALPAAKILPFVRPVEKLMSEWGVIPFATIDETVPYDPQYHQLTKGSASPGELVQVTHVGYRHHDKLLHRAKVKAVDGA